MKYLVDNGSILPELQKKNIVQDLYANVVEETLYIENNKNRDLDSGSLNESYKENMKYFDSPDE